MADVVKGWESQGFAVHLRQRVAETVAFLEGGVKCPNTHISFKTQGGVLIGLLDGGVRCPHRHVAHSREVVEDGVDDLIHAQINTHIALRPFPDTRNTLVLVTGDGNPNPSKYRPNTYGTTFVNCCHVAFRLGWDVELWSWKNSLNSVFLALAKEKPELMCIRYFDEFRDFVCDKQQGSPPRSHDRPALQPVQKPASLHSRFMG